MRSFRIGPFIIAGIRQGSGAPIIDSSTSIIRNTETNEVVSRYKGKAIHLTPWRKNQYGERLEGFALVLGIKV